MGGAIGYGSGLMKCFVSVEAPSVQQTTVIAVEVPNGNFEESDTEMDSEDDEISDFSPEEETRKSDQVILSFVRLHAPTLNVVRDRCYIG